MSRPKGCSVTLVLIVTLGALSQSGCIRSFVTRPQGRLGQELAFVFYEKEGVERPSRLNVVQLYVQERHGDSWTTVWELKGRAALDRVVYGRKYEGLDERVAPSLLSVGGSYQVYVRDYAWPGPSGQSGEYFSFDEHGLVVVTKTPK